MATRNKLKVSMTIFAVALAICLGCLSYETYRILSFNPPPDLFDIQLPGSAADD